MLTRRRVLTASIQGCLLLGSAALLPACGDAATTRQSLLEYAQKMEAISHLGPNCIPQTAQPLPGSDEEDRERLLQELLAGLGENLDPEALATRLDARIREDFEAMRVVEVDGWRLSATECTLAALAALLQGIREATSPEARELATNQFVEVTDWGPRSTIQGQTFNEQPDGHSGIWIRAEGAPASTVVVFAGQPLATQVYPHTLTSGLQGKFMQRVIDSPGTYQLELLDRARQIRQPFGEFTVVPAVSESGRDGAEVAQCTFEGWGPQYSYAGEPFNEQPDGRSAFWVRTACALPDSQLLLDGKKLRTTVREGLLTAGVPWGHELAPGLHELALVPGGSDTVVTVGEFRVEP